MKKIVLKILLAIDVLAIIIHTVLAHFITKVDYASGIVTDGFGRVFVEPPLFFRWYLYIGEWVGLWWFIIDTVGFFVAFSVAIAL